MLSGSNLTNSLFSLDVFQFDWLVSENAKYSRLKISSFNIKVEKQTKQKKKTHPNNKDGVEGV